ncbi:MAG: hypothetical protein AAFZ15_28980 [Bacteroidota bacterium]
MKNTIKILFLIYLFAGLQIIAFCQNRIELTIPTAAEETEYVWRTIRDISFFEKFNYQVNLPKGKLIIDLINRSKANNLNDHDYKSLQQYLQDSIYKKSDYKAGYQKIAEQEKLINELINKINKCKKNWKFREFQTYRIHLTLYGSGGSYNPDDGSIIIFTTPEGQFKSYQNPANTIIHEVTHIGMEASIMQQYNVPHAMKERIIDQFVLIHFGNALPSYRLQDLGDNRIDQYLKKKSDFKNLHLIIEHL